MQTSITRDLGCFIAGVSFRDLPAEAVRVAKLAFLDGVAVLIAGRTDPAPQLLMSALDPGAGDATLLFGSRRANAADAAWINATAAHALDYDDVAMRGHPSCVIVPAILAEAETLGSPGRQMIAAYVAAYETWAELVLRDSDPQHVRGWHLTGWIGSIAAAAACASLRQLSADACAMALSIAASQSAGLMVNTGTMTKPFHAGRAAHAGVVAARLAERGFTGALDGLEHPTGWLRSVSSGGRVDLARPVAAGSPWRIEQLGVAIRRHSVCYVGHRLVDGMLELVERVDLKPDDAAEIVAATGRPSLDILRFHRPTNASEAKFSIEFGLAAALLRRRVTPAELDDDFVRSEAVQALMARIAVEVVEEAQGAGAASADRIRIRTRSGAEVSSLPVAAIVGSPQRPLSTGELHAKFAGCLRHGAPAAAKPDFIDAFIARLNALDQLSDARELRAFAC
jgi:2-methylcitrate dehydratase PrpD